MKNRIAKERIIFDNYDCSEEYEEARQYLIDEGNEEPSDSEIWDELYFQNEMQWYDTKEELDKFFDGKTVGFFGAIGRWNGVFRAGKIGEFWKLYYEATRDCDYIKISDENGKLFLRCSHHDGTNFFEIKEITNKGYDYLERWEYGTDDRAESEVHEQIYKRYSHNPNFAHKVYGCRAREYEPQSKEGFLRILNNQAKSFYT